MDPATLVPNVIIGSVLVVLGILAVMFRQRLFAAIVRWEKSAFGRVGDRTQQRASPFWVGFAGFGAVAFGLSMVVPAVIGLVQSAG